MGEGGAMYQYDFLTLEQALKLLPNVKPRKAKETIEECADKLYSMYAYDCPLNCEGGKCEEHEAERMKRHVVLGGVIMTAASFDGLHICHDPYRCSPDGAKILIELYKGGTFELKRKKDQIEEPYDLIKYSESLPEIIEKHEAKSKGREEWLKRWREKASHPESIKESEFEFYLLASAFKEAKKKGCCSMVIGGIEVSKSVMKYRSNSGKSEDWDVSFCWTGSDGKTHSVAQESSYKNNRWNDIDRRLGFLD